MKTKYSIDDLIAFAQYEKQCFIKDAKDSDDMRIAEICANAAQKFDDILTILNKEKESHAQR